MLSINKEQLSELEPEIFNRNIHIVDSAAKARDAARFLLKQDRIGFDTETRPSFQKGHMNKVALVQLSTFDECFLFRVNLTGITKPLKQIIESNDLLKIGLSVKDDFHALRKLDDTIEPQGFVDLQTWVKDFSIADNSLSRIYGIVFNKRISKSQRLSNWEAEELTEAQQHYAALDAWSCLQIHNHLSQGLFDPESSPYKIEENPETKTNQS